ncbi:MAG: protein-L-isoaspartate O-methyltransferase [Burkholderiales bacterium PBB4]|nr:MAG: protein-L-isoaspartate O-methyltransferase [Burkholderiales bacterium PBB4]
MNFEQARFNMIEQQIRPWDVLDTSVLQLLSVVKREDFVPPAMRGLAFADLEIPLSAPSEVAMRMGQCMLAPRLEARLLQDAAVKPHESVLEIGSGSGYMAALLAGKARHVLTLEIDSALAVTARHNLRKAGVQNVEVRHADGAVKRPAEGKFDVILLSGSVAMVPDDLLELLNVGGRLCAIVGDEPVMRATVVTRTSPTALHSVQSWDTQAPRLLNFAEPSRFQF